MTDLSAIKTRQQQAWATGDYTVIGASTVIVSELLCETVDIHAGDTVLDIATGSGNTALAAARRGAEVTGVDYVAALLERAQERATAERLQVTWHLSDAEHLPFPDAAFDVVLSTFGIMFAPVQETAARELLRVCRPGGKIGLANWTPEGYSGENFRVTGKYLSAIPGFKPPTRWGTTAGLQELLGDAVSALQVTRRNVVFRAPSAEEYLTRTRRYLGPVMKVFESLTPEAQADLHHDLLDNIQRFNQSSNGTMRVPAEYLEIVAIRR